MSKYTVERATEKDLFWILTESVEFLSQVNPDYVNEEYLPTFVQNLMKAGVVLISKKDGIERTGMIGGAIVSSPFNPNIHILTEIAWWVPEHYRKTRSGYLLLQEFINYGKENNVYSIVLSSLTNTPVSDETFEKRGFILKEKAYEMRL